MRLYVSRERSRGGLNVETALLNVIARVGAKRIYRAFLRIVAGTIANTISAACERMVAGDRPVVSRPERIYAA